MALYDDPPHRVDIYPPQAPTQDSGGGVVLGFRPYPDQSGCPCSIWTMSAGTIERYAQKGITVTHRIAILSELLTVQPVRGTKYVSTDTGIFTTYIQMGLRTPDRQYGSIPPLTYIDVQEQL